MYIGRLTTETLRKKFKNNFNLCNFAIQIGRNLVLGDNSASLNQVLQAVEDQIDADQLASTHQETEHE